ncbi:LysR family transcriptional regulator [Paucibacter sp. DJ2R-2]|uniref:LysR family transcriptional regulator n=1 Tax=Paucibacter sp. DJ2R-2 TaxID=2893558 RepID=UPI0021E3CDF9|nr:LysR family transcriptional regulator [Paucibacter sp. DJ2R-2]MCV2419340.1 LysR family transcriptional regulator [Paucibacter sp. DJ4R-1]MCV2437756.1 LysR family transcriptional regulator [Paucibacter sp. DJ2R-2]
MKIENTDELRLLLECARGGSLTAASKVMDITPAAASAMLKKLEARLGLRLVERSTRALRLTQAGEQLREHGQRALELLDEGLALALEADPVACAAGSRAAGAAAPSLRGRIRVSAPSDLTRQLLLPLFDEFLERHPAVELQLSVSDSLLDLVKDEVDLALRYGQLPDSGLVARRLALVRRMAVASPAYLERHGRPGHPSELSQHACLTFKIRNRHERSWRFRPRGQEAAAPLVVAVHGPRSCDDAAIAHQWALQGFGVIYKSALDVRLSLGSGALVDLFPDWQGDDLPLHALMPSQRFLPQRVRALVDHLAQGLSGA